MFGYSLPYYGLIAALSLSSKYILNKRFDYLVSKEKKAFRKEILRQWDIEANPRDSDLKDIDINAMY